MGLKSLAAFASLSGLVFLGVDYEQQARRAGLGLGELSAGGYVDSFRARFAGVQEAQRLAALEQERQQRWNVGGKAFLPEALEGMERFSLPERLDLFTEDIVEQSKEEEEADRLDELDQALSEIRLQRWAQRQDASSWGYIKNDEVLVLSISLRGKVNPNSLSGMIVSAMSNVSLPGKPFAVIGGVAYGREGGIGHSERRMKRYQGTMGLGERAIITLDAVASEETIRSLLAAIDYDGLNSLFLKPEETVGNDVVVPSDAEAELAEAIYDLRDEMRQISSKAVRLKMQGIDPARLVASAMTGSGIPLTGAVGGADITDGKIPDVGPMLETVYRQRLLWLMSQAGAVKGDESFLPEDNAALPGDQGTDERNTKEQALLDGGAETKDGSGRISSLAGSLLGLLSSEENGEANLREAPSEETPTPEVKIRKALVEVQGSGERTGCIRRGTALTCD